MTAATALDAALEYAERGFRVFPLRDSGDDNNRKLPQHKGWPEAATIDAEAIRRWWYLTSGAGIGVATGDGLLVLDVDNKNGKNGDASLAALLSEHGEFPATLSATTPNGGTHYYLRGPDVSNSVDQLGVGLDVRGHHGYVVAPSPARCGVGYTWRNDEEIADAPQWLIDAATARESAASRVTTHANASNTALVVAPGVIDDLRSALRRIDADHRPTWIRMAACLRELETVGFDLWCEYSRRSEKWKESGAAEFWTVGADRAGHKGIFAAAQAAGWPNPNAAERDGRTRVVYRRGKIHETVDAAETAMLAANAPLYARGEILVRLATGVEHAHVRRSASAPILTPATPAAIREEMERACRFVSISKGTDAETGEPVERTRTVDCPPAAPGVYLSRVGDWRVPHVVGIAEAPIIRADGRIVADGYDAEEGVLVVARGAWPTISEHPTTDDARVAMARLATLVERYDFVAEYDRSVTLAAMLTAIARPTLRAAPAFGWSATVRGSGKSKLADVCAILATGRTAAAMAWPADDAEAEKRIGAAVLAGDPVLLIDNVEQPIGSQVLNSLLTQESIGVRILGKSQVARIGSRATLLITGNNLCISGDLTRRILVAEIDPRVERPELRSFAFDPVERARRERPALVAACLTVLRFGLALPQQATPLGSFEDWSRRVRDPLLALGYADPCECLARLLDHDPERECALELMGAWHARFGNMPMTTALAIRDAERDRSAALYEAISAVAGGPGGINARRFGRYLARIKGRLFGASAFRQSSDPMKGHNAWRVEIRRPIGVAA